MEGVGKRLEREAEDRSAMAHEIAWFTRQERLKPFAHYRRQRKSRAQTPSEMLAALQEFKARGVPMTIRRGAPSKSGKASQA